MEDLTITDEEFDDMLVSIVSSVFNRVVSQESKSFIPMLSVFGLSLPMDSKRVQLIVPILDADAFDNDRVGLMEEMGTALYRDMGVIPGAVFLISEATELLDESDEKKNVLLAFGQRMDGRSNLATMNVDRDDEGKIHLSGTEYNLVSNREETVDTSSPLLAHFYRGFLLQFIKDVSQ